MKEKTCASCGKKFEATYDNFYKVEKNRTKMSAECKWCFDLAPRRIRGKGKMNDISPCEAEGGEWLNGSDEIYC